MGDGNQEALNALTEPLLLWYEQNRRHLPWRETITPYTTWVSEIMLQQTRVAAVIPYYERFLVQLPDVFHLAAVSEEKLFKLWEGLGYYSRARNLRRAAQQIVSEYGGIFPQTVEQLRKLPGIGAYTAAAIASIVFDAVEPAVDGNLLRVTARVMGSDDDVMEERTRKRLTQCLREAIDPQRPGMYNQAMMDLGAMVCLPNTAPLCMQCPARRFCESYRRGWTELLPVRGRKKARRVEERTVFLLWRDGRLALHRRPDSGLLAGLWEFPNTEGNLDGAAAQVILAGWGLTGEEPMQVGFAKHIFTHIEWHMKAYEVQVDGDAADFLWVDRAAFSRLALPTAFRKFVPIVMERWGREEA